MSEAQYDPWAIMRSLGAQPVSKGRRHGLTIHRGENWIALWEPDSEHLDGLGNWRSSCRNSGFHGTYAIRVRLSAEDIDYLLDYHQRFEWYSMWQYLEERYKQLNAEARPSTEVELLQKMSVHADRLYTEDGAHTCVCQLEWDGDHGDCSTVGITSVGFVPMKTPYIHRTGWQINMRWATEPVTEEDILAIANVMRKREAVEF